MGLPAIRKGVTLIAGHVARLPLFCYRTSGDGSRKKDLRHPAYRLLMRSPSSIYTPFIFKRQAIAYTILYGNSYAYIVRDEEGTPQELLLLDPEGTWVEAESNVDLRPTTWNFVGHFPHPRWHFGFSSPFHNHDFLDGYMRGFRHKIILPRGPLQSVTSVKYYDFDNTQQDWTNSDTVVNYYVMRGYKTLGWIQPALYWPSTFDTFRPDAVTITFTSGYSPAPAIAQQAVLLAVGTFFENRESETEANLKTLGLGFDRLLDMLTIEGVTP